MKLLPETRNKRQISFVLRDPTIKQDIKVWCANEGISLANFYELALLEKLNRDRKRKITVTTQWTP